MQKFKDFKKIKITFVGDIMQHPEQLRYEEDNDFDYDCFKNIKHLLKGDMVIGNLETTFSGYHGAPDDRNWHFVAPEKFAYALKKAGFTHLVLANNHMFDSGYHGFELTKRVIKEAGMTPLCRLDYINIKGKSVQFLNFTTHFNPNKVTKDVLKKYKNYDITNVDGDIKVAFAHWGGQYNPTPDKEQLSIGNYLMDKDYTVIGSGPHTPHQIENNDKLVAYSLGDFLSDHQKPNTTNKGIILNLTFENNKVIDYKETAIHTETVKGSSTIKVS